MADTLNSILVAAQRCRDKGQWADAIRLFKKSELAAPGDASIKHNLAMAYFVTGAPNHSRQKAEEALRVNPGLWQSQALLAKLDRTSGAADKAAASWRRVLECSPNNPTALLGLADVWLNEFGNPEQAAALVEPLTETPGSSADAELTGAMASLYRGGSADEISRRLMAFSRNHLRLPPHQTRQLRSGRRRIGLISPLFTASPVYYLTYSAWKALAASHDLIFFSRSARTDEATALFRALSHEWHDVASMEATNLSSVIWDAEIDILFDLGGWSDVGGLTAISSKPAARMYKWIGGQSATTGLDTFDGWIGDTWQSPSELANLYTEPLINMDGGYADYTPPATINEHRDRPKKGVGLVGNPAKIGTATVASWPRAVDKVRLIDRRYAYEEARSRVVELLNCAGIQIESVVAPRGHNAYLRELATCEAIVNTQPYSAGLTAVEAHWMGVRTLEGGPPGNLFCSRHHLSHAKTGGTNTKLAIQLLRLVSQ